MTTFRIVGDYGTGPTIIASGLNAGDAQTAADVLTGSIRVEPDPAPLTPADGYDFMELVIFDGKVDNEGFEYAFEHYGPRFRRPDLKPLENDYRGLKDLYEDHTDAINLWWDDHQDDGDDLYDAQLRAHDEEQDRRHNADAPRAEA